MGIIDPKYAIRNTQQFIQNVGLCFQRRHPPLFLSYTHRFNLDNDLQSPIRGGYLQFLSIELLVEHKTDTTNILK